MNTETQTQRHARKLFALALAGTLIAPAPAPATATPGAATPINSLNTRVELNVGAQNGSVFGSTVARIGDVNGDGIIDYAGGAPADDTTGTDRGAAYVLLMRADRTISQTIKLSAGSNGAPGLGNGDNFGRGLAGIGDINADGIPDLAVGAYADDTGGVGGNRGAVHLLMLTRTGTVSSSIKIAQSLGGFTPTLAASDFFGVSIDTIGDLNADGKADLIVGASGTGVTGGAYVLFMGITNTVSQSVILAPNWNGIPSMNFGANFGLSVSGIGDVNNDGIPDIAFGAPNDVATDRGRVVIGLMKRDGTVATGVTLASGINGIPVLPNGANFGFDVAGLGDIDGDGIPDLAVSSPLIDASSTDTGAVWIVNLNSDGSARRVVALADNVNGMGMLPAASGYGFAVDSAGDLNQDGIVDLLVGVNREGSGAAVNRGDAHLLLLGHQPTDLRLTHEVTPAQVYANDPVTYRIVFTNTSAFTAIDAVITHRGADFTSVSISNSGATLSTTLGAGDVFTWTIPALNSGQGGIITVTGFANSAYWNQTVVATATITARRRRAHRRQHPTASFASLPPPPVDSVTAENSGPAVPGAGVTLSASASSIVPIYGYTWTPGDGSPDLSGPVATHVYTAPGDYVASVYADNIYRVGAVATTTVRIRAPLQGLAVFGPSSATTGMSAPFSATVSGGDADVFEWQFGDGTSATGASTARTYITPGNYVITVTARNLVSSLVATTTLQVNGPAITPSPTPSPIPTAIPTPVPGSNGVYLPLVRR